MKITRSGDFPGEDKIFWDKFGVAVGIGPKMKKTLPILTKKLGEPSSKYYNMLGDGELIGVEWLFANRKDKLAKIARLKSLMI